MRTAESRARQLMYGLGMEEKYYTLYVSSMSDYVGLSTYHNGVYISVSFEGENICIEAANDHEGIKDLILGFKWTGVLTHTIRTEMNN